VKMDTFIEAEEVTGHSVKRCCELFEVSRETRRNHYLSPATGEDAEAVLGDALVTLATRRELSPGDAGVTLHLLVSLTAQADRRLPRAVLV
jgi:hypothetical protein